MRSEKSASARDSRRVNKPMMEKRRRARINASLSELKSLLLDAINKEGGRHNKMEKADILEMTVKHLREIQRHSLTDAAAEDPSNNSLSKHRHGYNECKQEVSRYLDTVAGCDAELKTRVLDHLTSKTMTSLPDESNRETASPAVSSHQVRPSSNELPKTSTDVAMDINNNVASVTSLAETAQVFSAMPVIPTKLSSGEVAFVVPANFVNSRHVSNYAVPSNQNTPSLSNHILSGTPVTSLATTQVLTVPTSSAVYPMTQVAGNVTIIPCSGIAETRLVSPPAQLSQIPVKHVQQETHVQVREQNQNGIHGSHFESRDNLECGKGSIWRPWSQI